MASMGYAIAWKGCTLGSTSICISSSIETQTKLIKYEAQADSIPQNRQETSQCTTSNLLMLFEAEVTENL
jgi:hypothetical protein